jgi:hypothetical protein
MREILDTALNKVMSRKLMVWGAATVFMFMDAVPLASEDWVAISLAYIGIEGLGDIASRWRHGR